MAEQGLSDRVRFQAGDFFEDELPSAQMSMVIDVRSSGSRMCRKKKLLLAKAFANTPKGGAVIVYDAIIDDERRKNAFGLLMSLNMLIETPGGFDYTGGLIASPGCTKQVSPRPAWAATRSGPDSMVIGIK